MLIFRGFCDWCLKYIFKAIIFIHAAFSDKIEVFRKIFIHEISNIPLICIFHIFLLSTLS